MIAPLNCDECKMQYRCTCVSTDCKYPEGRQYGVTTYDKMRADERSALEKRLEEAEKVIDEYANSDNWWIHDEYDPEGYVLGTVFDFRGTPLAMSYRAKYPKGGE